MLKIPTPAHLATVLFMFGFWSYWALRKVHLIRRSQS